MDARTILSKVIACLSVLGSLTIAREVLIDKKKRDMVYHRQMLALSLADVTFSIVVFVGGWGASNPGLCKAKAFFSVMSGTPTAMYNTGISVYYFLLICRKLTEQQMRKIQYILLFFPFLWGFGTAMASLFLDLYARGSNGCWINKNPKGCEGDECISGANADLYGFWFVYIPRWVSFCVSFLCMTLVYFNVAKGGEEILEQELPSHPKAAFAAVDEEKEEVEEDENENDAKLKAAKEQELPSRRKAAFAAVDGEKEEVEEDENENDVVQNEHDMLWFLKGGQGQATSASDRARRMAKQAFWYLVTYFNTYFWVTLQQVLKTVGDGSIPYWVRVMVSLTLPSQGIFNCIVYLRPRYLRNREKYPEMSRPAAVFHRDEEDFVLGARQMRSMANLSSNNNTSGHRRQSWVRYPTQWLKTSARAS
ncbi:hypothetical protein ACHAWF_013258 [Thalassiosira exigua]